MKKQILTFACAIITIGMVSCGGGANENSLTQEQADSIANAKLDSAAAALKFENDSIIAATAQREADSIRIADSLAAVKAGKKPASPAKPSKPVNKNNTTNNTNTTPAKPEEPKKETIGEGKPKMGGGNSNTVGEGKPKMGTSSTQEKSTVGEGKPKMGTK